MSRPAMREHTGASLGITALIVVFVMALPALYLVTIYTFITVYAIAKAFEAAGPANPLTVFLGVMSIVALFAVLMGVGISIAGRSLDPKRRPLVPALIRKIGRSKGARGPAREGPNGHPVTPV